MAARNTPLTDGLPKRKAVLFCPRCGHESRLSGDWRIEETNPGREYACPECGTTVVEQPNPLVA